MGSLSSTLRIVLNIGFAVLNMIANRYINAIADNAKYDCPVSTGWKITNGKLITSLLFIVACVNIFLPINNVVASIPLIGTGGILLFLMLLSIELYILKSVSKQLKSKECSENNCDVSEFKIIRNYMAKQSISNLLIISAFATVIFFYF